jgi:hypothetical protein
MPIMYQAFSLYADPPGRTRSAVEARILAAEAPQVIAQKGGIPPEVIQAYELVFFDVRPHLQNPDYVLNEVIGPSFHKATGSGCYDPVWKLFGYIGGGHALDAVMDISARSKPKGPQEVGAFLVKDAHAVVRRQLAVAARLLAAGDPRATAEVLKMQASLLLRDSEGDSEKARSELEKHISAMIQEIPWMVGRGAAEKVPPKVATYDEGAVELHDEELLRLGAGEDVPGLPDPKQTMPPPRPRTEQGRKGLP